MNDIMSVKYMRELFYGESKIRVYEDPNNPKQLWFVAKDLCSVIDVKCHNKAANRLDTSQRGYRNVPDNRGVLQRTLVVNLSGLVELTIDAKSKQAVNFRRWLIDEVATSVLLTGRYTVRQTTPRKRLFDKRYENC